MSSPAKVVVDLQNFDFSAEITKLQAQLEEERNKEKVVDEKMSDILRQNVDLPRQLQHVLSRMRTRLTLIESDSSQLSSSLSLTSVLAENISGKVRELDLAKNRVVECLQRVEDLHDLKQATEGVQAALHNEDFEQAAGHIHRFLALDSAVFQMGEDFGSGGANSGGGGHSLKESYEVLKEAEKELKGIVEAKFDEAVEEGDIASVERFFKIFPLLNQHDVGIEKFAEYLRAKIKDAAEKNFQIMKAGGQDDKRSNVLYADTLTLLFEGIARIIEIHQPLVENYYGPERMLNLAKHLQVECDHQSKLVVDEFVRVRQYDKKARLVETYVRQASKYANMERMEPLELDVLLSEVTLLHTRAELYLRFIKRRVGADLETIPAENPDKVTKQKELATLIKSCGLSRQMQELIGQYISMEQYYMQRSIEKAVEMNSHDEDSLTSSMVDDVFFIIRKSVRRSLSSSSVDCVCAMLNNACTLLETDFHDRLKNHLKAGYPVVGSFAEAYTTAAAAYSSVMSQGKMPASGVEGAEKAREDFLTALNNCQASGDCVQTLKNTLEADIGKHLPQTTEHEKAKLDHCSGQLTDVIMKFKEATKFGIDQLVLSAVKPRVKSGAEEFNNYTHTPTEAEFGDFEANDPFVQQFITILDSLLGSLQPVLLENAYQDLLTAVSAECARQLEKMIFKSTFNRLGGLQLDKELRELSAFLTSVSGWALREKFARITQIASLLNVESVADAREYYQSGSVTWRLTPSEVRQTLALRIDIPGDEIRKVKL